MSENIFGARDSARQARTVAGSKMAVAFLALVVQIAIARELAVEDYAKFTLFLAAASILALLSMCGMDRVAFRVLPHLRLACRWREALTFMASALCVRLLVLALIAGVLGGTAAGVLPEHLVHQLGGMLAVLAAFTIALCITDGLAFFCNGVGKHSAQGMVALVVAMSRSIAVLWLLVGAERVLLSQILWAYAGAEFILAVVLLVLLVRDARAQQEAGNQEPFRFEFDVAELAREGAATQSSYILRIPFQGPFMRLLVGAFAGPLVTAAYGFFQAIADRIYHFMPMIMLKGVVEPAMVADYGKNKNLVRQSMVVALLLKVSLVILLLIASVTLAIGEPVVNFATGGKYGAQIWIALLIGLQLVAQMGGEALWIGLNAVGRVNVINRVWAGAAAFSGLLMLIAFLMQNISLLIFSATLPYVVAFAWLRWVRAEPLLSAGLGERAALLLLVPLAIAVISSRAVLWLLGESLIGVACAGVVVCVAFFLATVAMRPITREEQTAVRQVSPRLAVMIAPLVARR